MKTLRFAFIPAAVVAALVCSAPRAHATPQFSLTLIPASGDIAGAAGTTIGWGYTIDNDSDLWLEVFNLDSGAFAHGTGDASVFDFPILAPHSTRVTAFNAGSGLFQLTWDAGAPAGFTNTGTFLLTANLWDGDPFLMTSAIVDGTQLSADYSATVAGTEAAVPEPATLLLTASGLAAARLRRRRR